MYYGGFPYNMGDSHAKWLFPVAGNKGEKKNIFMKLKSNQIKSNQMRQNFRKKNFQKKK